MNGSEPQQIDHRHQKREQVMQALFAYSFSEEQAELDHTLVAQVKEILAEAPEIDELLKVAAPERPLTEINKIDLAILRLIMFESRHKKTPKKVLLNEAVELAKTYGTTSSPKFVNAVLGAVLLPEVKSELETVTV